MLATQLQALIQDGLECSYIEVDGDGRHWSALVVSQAFEGLSTLARHRKVYATLGQRMHTDEVHALSIKAFTPSQWSALLNQ